MKYVYYDVKEKPSGSDQTISVAGHNFKQVAIVDAPDIIVADDILLKTKNIVVNKTPNIHCKLDIW